jgi:hypothetical protein
MTDADARGQTAHADPAAAPKLTFSSVIEQSDFPTATIELADGCLGAAATSFAARS